MWKAGPRRCARLRASPFVRRCRTACWTGRSSSWWTCRPKNCGRGWRRARSMCPNQPGRRRRTSSGRATSAALRELALRFAAEHVGQDVLAYRQAHGVADTWKTGQRLLVAVSASPTSAALVRWTRRLGGRVAGELGGGLCRSAPAPRPRPGKPAWPATSRWRASWGRRSSPRPTAMSGAACCGWRASRMSPRSSSASPWAGAPSSFCAGARCSTASSATAGTLISMRSGRRGKRRGCGSRRCRDSMRHRPGATASLW